ncbi:MAG: S-layer homology domain-containing protein [Clostridia bacterium]|nr:S-layer homology domain-containing protein [Clostridia bacterium]
MKKPFLRFFALCLCVASLSAAASFPASAELKRYNDFDLTEIAKLPESSGCYSSQGMAVGEEYIYAVQIGGDNSVATVTRVDRESGATTKMKDAATGKKYFEFLGHANDMDVVKVNGVEYLTVLTYGGGVAVLEVQDTALKLHGEYFTKRGSNIVSPGSLSVKSVEGSVITFLCRQGYELHYGTLDLEAETDTIKLIPKYSLNPTTPIIDGKTYDFSGWLGQGIGVVGDMVLVIITGNHVVETINHSIILGYDLSKATSYRLTTPDLVFYIVSDKYYGLFEIEDCDVAPDGKIYFNTNGRRVMNGSSDDGIYSFDAYTFTDVKPLVGYTDPSVYAEAGEGGTISPAGTTQIEAGGEVTYTIRPDRGYRIDTVTVNGQPVETASTYTFSDLRENKTIKVTFAWDNPFTDVTENDWFLDDVEYVSRRGIMLGTADTVFSPNMTLTRAQMVTMLWRLAGEPSVKSVSFADVPAGQWYSDAVVWAASEKIVEGYGDGNFYPDASLTREQAMAILHRYAGGAEIGVNTALYLSSDWARDDVSWAASVGILQDIGADVTDQTQPATRAEIAAYLTRFCLNVID